MSKLSKSIPDWARLNRKFEKLKYKSKKYDSGSISLTFRRKTLSAKINVSGLDTSLKNKCEYIIYAGELEIEVWKQALKLYKRLKENQNG